VENRSYHYLVHGLHIESALACPELHPTKPNKPDVTIRYGSVPETLDNPIQQSVSIQAGKNQFLLKLDNIAQYWVTNGTNIVIKPALNSQEADIRLFLLGSSFGALLHQRGCFILHGSAIETKAGAVIFVGHSGVGKSTLAAACHTRGYRILADDVSTLDYQNLQMYPGLAHIQLWEDAAKKLAHDPNTMRQTRTDLEKYALSLQDGYDPTPVPLHAIYVLNISDQPDFKIEPITVPSQKFDVLLNNTYRDNFLNGLAVQVTHFKQATTLATHLKISRVTRPKMPYLLDELVEILEKDWVK